VDAIYSKSFYVTGKAEANSLVTIKYGTKVIASGKVNKYGNFKIKIVRQKRGVTLIVGAMDMAMNMSKPTYVKDS
jgi:hypothetical protein